MQPLYARHFNANGRSGGNTEPGSKPMITIWCDAQGGLYLGNLSGGVILEINQGRCAMPKQKENRVTVISVRGHVGM